MAIFSVHFWSHISQEAQGQNYTLILIVVMLHLIGRYFADFKKITENAVKQCAAVPANVWGAWAPYHCGGNEQYHDVLQVMARLWQHIIQCFYHGFWSQIHAVVVASVVHALPTEVSQKLLLETDSWQIRSTSPASLLK